MKSYDDIIQERQNEIFNEIQDIEQEIQHLTARIEQLQAKRKSRFAEYEMLRDVQDKGLAQSTRPSRLHIEDALKRIFDRAGRPLSMTEILKQLKEFGFEWSSYQSGYARVRDLDLIEHTGARGYYNLVRVR